jgi:hypothetical protein
MTPTKQEALAALDALAERSVYENLEPIAVLRRFIDSTATGLDALERAVVEASVSAYQASMALSDDEQTQYRRERRDTIRALLAARAGEKT